MCIDVRCALKWQRIEFKENSELSILSCKLKWNSWMINVGLTTQTSRQKTFWIQSWVQHQFLNCTIIWRRPWACLTMDFCEKWWNPDTLWYMYSPTIYTPNIYTYIIFYQHLSTILRAKLYTVDTWSLVTAEQHLKLYSNFYSGSAGGFKGASESSKGLMCPSQLRALELWTSCRRLRSRNPVTRSCVFWTKKWQHRPVKVAMHPLTAQTPRCHESTAWHDTWKFDLKLVSALTK